MLKPEITIQLWPLTVNPWSWPVTVTLEPGDGAKEMGAPEMPDRLTFTFSKYVPELTRTDTPGLAAAAAAEMVQNGWLTLPGPELLQLVVLPST